MDHALSPEVARRCSGAGHARVQGPQAAADTVIFARPTSAGRILMSSDTDFAKFLAVARERKPSLILFREPDVVRARDYARYILDSLRLVGAELEVGSIVVLRRARIRVRMLPLGSSSVGQVRF